jgi:hypothetical protein
VDTVAQVVYGTVEIEHVRDTYSEL